MWIDTGHFYGLKQTAAHNQLKITTITFLPYYYFYDFVLSNS
jgi:hypothetical protein